MFPDLMQFIMEPSHFPLIKDRSNNWRDIKRSKKFNLRIPAHAVVKTLLRVGVIFFLSSCPFSALSRVYCLNRLGTSMNKVSKFHLQTDRLV